MLLRDFSFLIYVLDYRVCFVLYALGGKRKIGGIACSLSLLNRDICFKPTFFVPDHYV